ncbi:MAG TPA: hypothetical protein VK152_05405, partial [Paludibacter sp.]|nr:hypothetical protein [Paludibacter sp.]
MKKKLLIFENALAPYRIDLFNGLNKVFDTTVYFFRRNMRYDKFDTKILESQLNFKPRYLTFGIEDPFRDRMYRFGCIAKVLQHRPQIVIGLEFTTMTFFTALFCRLFMPSTRVYTMCD